MYEMNFINNCLYGLTDIEEIDDYVEAWHNGQSNLKLSDYLGMTQDEYEAWIQKEKQKIYALWYGNLNDEDFYYDSAGLPAPDIELQGIVMRKAQWLFPTLVPEGTTAIPAVEGETFGVQL